MSKQNIANTVDRLVSDPNLLSSFKLNKTNLEFIEELRKSRGPINPKKRKTTSTPIAG